jgi:hypothetical protein
MTISTSQKKWPTISNERHYKRQLSSQCFELNLCHFNMKSNHLFGVVTDGAAAMVGKEKGLVAVIIKEADV